ncbi:MAG: hypothetical protein U0441_07095 [Polyangiaceae bacterium]
MRVFGGKASIETFRWDFVYLAAQTLSDKRQDVLALAPSIQAKLGEIKTERDALEAAEDQEIFATALLNKRDRARDEVLVVAGGVTRNQDKALYQTLFGKLSPSETAKLGLDAESKEVARILGEIGKLPANHPIRVTYEADITSSEAELKTAKTGSDAADTALALQRSQMFRFKLDLDKFRVELHGKLLALLKDKEEANSFFRPTKLSPEETADKASDTANPNAPKQPVVPPNPVVPPPA